jgi:hypothetical protein
LIFLILERRLGMKLRNPYYEVLCTYFKRSEYQLRAMPTRLEYIRQFLHWKRQAETTPVCSYGGNEKLTVILLSYRRVRNMEPLVANLLHTDFVEKVIVSNNNPEYRIGEWIRLRDPRLQLIDQPQRTPPGIRFELARHEPGPYFLSIDDDVLLYPEQVLRLFEHLVANPGVPHGFQGEEYKPDHPRLWDVALRGEREVDNINCLYAFHKDHLIEMERLADQLGIELRELANGEDLLVSASGAGRPRVHELGQVLICLSSHREGVATWRSRRNFFQERRELFGKLRALKPRLGPGPQEPAEAQAR